MILILLCAIAPFVHARGIHEYMTADEIMQVFQTTPDNVPEYEIVPVKHIFNKRADNYIVETAFQNSRINLNLKQTESILIGQNTKVWTANKNSYHAHGIEYNLIQNAFKDVGIFYEDPENLAAFAMTKEDEDGMNEFDKILLLDGFFTMHGNNMVLRSLPKRHRLKRDIQQLDSSSDGDNTNITATADHVIFQIRESPLLSKSSRSANSFVQKLDGSEITKKSKRNIPDVIYPEILLIVDEHFYLNFKGNVAKALSYIVTFWNGVDLRYRALSEPEVRLNIAGIILSEDKIPFFYSFIPSTNDKLNADRTLEEIGEYLYKEKRFLLRKDYDLALLMTGYDMFSGDGKPVAGVAWSSSACQSWPGQIMSLGLFQDNCGFDGILTAAHELAHVFGAEHDAEHCEYGHMMTGKGHVSGMDNLYQFSSCSQKEMRRFFQTATAVCLFNTPPKDEPVPMILPGQYMSLDEQCRKRGALKAIIYDKTVCTQLCCSWHWYLPVSEPCGLPAVEGSPCGNNLHCLDGACEYKSMESDY